MSEEISVEARKKLELLRDEIKSFLGSKLHVIYKNEISRDLASVSESILETPADSEKTVYYILELKGQYRALQSSLTLYEDAVSNLEDRIQTLLDKENETTQNNQE